MKIGSEVRRFGGSEVREPLKPVPPNWRVMREGLFGEREVIAQVEETCGKGLLLTSCPNCKSVLLVNEKASCYICGYYPLFQVEEGLYAEA